jgi:serine/threonine protein kinase
MNDTLPVRVRLGVFEVDLRAGELREGQQVLVLQEQPLRILCLLIERGGEILTRDEIRKKLWPNDTVVEFDHSINAAIKKLRRAFGDSAEQPKYIETIARRGYRLMVQATVVDETPPSPREVVSDTPDGGPPLPSERVQVGSLIGKKVSHYRVLSVIGGGGMGLVYSAEDLKLGRRVALKFLPEEVAWDPVALRRFEREARTASSLDHPNICTIYEVEEHEDQPFLVMPLLQGETLRDRLAAVAAGQKTLTVNELLDFGIQIADGLHSAHEKSIIHRDIKPANIFLTNTGQVKILDFGLAKLVESVKEGDVENARLGSDCAITRGMLPIGTPDRALTRLSAAMGTASYMSPEQVRGEQLDPRTDLFSFGLVLFEMATGQRAFSGDTIEVVHENILKGTPLPIRNFRSSVPTKLERVIGKALEKDRERRYQTVQEMREDLEVVRGALRAPVVSLRVKIFIALLLSIAVMLAAYHYWRSHGMVGFGGAEKIVLAEFTNSTGHSAFDGTMRQAPGMKVEQSRLI